MDRDKATQLLEEVERLERLARSREVERLAVLATFDPARSVGPDGDTVRRRLCRGVQAGGGHGELMLLERHRVDALARVLQRGGVEGLRELRASVTPDFATPLQRVLDAVVAGDRLLPVDLEDEDDLLAAVEVLRWADEAFAHAGLGKPVVEPTKDAILGRLALLGITHPVRRLLVGGCIGRDEELARLHAFHRSPARPGLDDEPAMVVHGVGGVGKSTLVARFVMDLYQQSSEHHWAWAYVDLDRPTLKVGDPLLVLSDIVAQVAAQFPAHAPALRRGQEVAYLRTKGAGLEARDHAHSARARASRFASGWGALGARSLVVVMDTFEEVERRHPERARDLYSMLDVLSDGIPGFRLVVSGRRPAERFVDPSRPDRVLHVRPMAQGPAVALLQHFVAASATDHPVPRLDDETAREVIRLVGGIPLTVRLAAQVLVREGPGAVQDAASYARTMEVVRSEFVRGFLYQRILDHIEVGDPVRTDQLRAYARAGLVLRRITRELVAEVLTPAVRLSPSPSPDAVFDDLAREVAFAELSGDGLHLREELRGPALAALRLKAPLLVEEVHRRAAEHFATTPSDPESATELAYHRLALGLVDERYDPAVLRALEPSVADLPERSAALVRRASEDPRSLEASEELARWERKVLAEGEGLLELGELVRLQGLLDERADRTEGSELHRLESRLHDRRGDLAAAADAAYREIGAAAAASDATRTAAGAVWLSTLLERLGAVEAAERSLSDAAAHPLLEGRPELRLELLLNRMTLLERRGRLTEDDRWTSELAVRALLQRVDPGVATADGAVVRLLAAALGGDEPERIRAAVQRVGLGFDEDDEMVRELVDALAAWDAEGPDPGRLARGAGLRPVGGRPHEVHRAWTVVSGLGPQAGALLDRVWAEDPPEAVLEAFRRLYLWWGFPRAGAGAAARRRRSEPDDEALPLDWTRPEVRMLEDVLLTAYHSVTDLQVLASRTGLDFQRISWSSSQRRVVREMLAEAVGQGRLWALVHVLLTDPEAASVRDRMTTLMADPVFRDWVHPHGEGAPAPGAGDPPAAGAGADD